MMWLLRLGQFGRQVLDPGLTPGSAALGRHGWARIATSRTASAPGFRLRSACLPPTEVFRFDPETFELGVMTVEAAVGERVRIYDPARTVVDLMRLRHRLGEPLAYAAMHRYLRRRDARPAALLRLATTLDVYGPLQRALDVSSVG